METFLYWLLGVVIVFQIFRWVYITFRDAPTIEVDFDLQDPAAFQKELQEFKEWKEANGKFYCHERETKGTECCTEPCYFCKQPEYKYRKYD